MEVRGKQEDGGGGVEGPAGSHRFPPSTHTGGCAGFGPLKSVSRCKVRTKGAGLSVAANKFTFNLCGRD